MQYSAESWKKIGTKEKLLLFLVSKVILKTRDYRQERLKLIIQRDNKLINKQRGITEQKIKVLLIGLEENVILLLESWIWVHAFGMEATKDISTAWKWYWPWRLWENKMAEHWWAQFLLSCRYHVTCMWESENVENRWVDKKLNQSWKCRFETLSCWNKESVWF